MEWRKLKRAKNVTWVIYCEHGPDGEREVSYGGGFCVNPQGLLVTVGHILPGDNRKIYARCISDTKFREAVVLKGQEWPKLDVALLWVQKLYPDETFHHVEEFEFLRGLNPSVSDYGDAGLFRLRTIIYPPPPAKKKLVMMTDTLARMSSGPGVSLSRDTPPPEAMKTCTWVIHVEFKRNGDSVTRVGGGVCIDEMGVILTVAHVIPDIERYTIKARQFNEGGVGGWVNVSVLRRWVDQDVAILLVKRRNKEEKFPIAELTRGLSLVESEPVFMFSHQDNVGYSLHDGVVAYQCPFDVNERDYVGDMEEAYQRNLLCRAAGHLIIGDDEDKIRHLDPKAPLLQLSGVDDYSGSSGTPYFRKSDNLLIGIMSLDVCNSAYAIPLKTLISLVETLSEPQESRRSKQKRQRTEEIDVSNPHDLVHRHGSETQGTSHLSETGACSKN